MRPFKFFFMTAVGIILFLFVVRVLFTALIIAAIFSLIYYIGRSIVHFFKRMDWDRSHYGYQMEYQLDRGERSYFPNSPYQMRSPKDSMRETIIKIQ